MPLSHLPDTIKNFVRPFYYAYQRSRLFLYGQLYGGQPVDCYSIPILINNYNRLTFLLQLIEALEQRGYRNIHIIDNASTYPALLNYYQQCPYPVYSLPENLGHLALWKSGIHQAFLKGYYVYTDSDIVMSEECPNDFMQLFLDKLRSDTSILKVGFSLKINDLPEHYRFKREVIANEIQYFGEKHGRWFYKANIDTTFALYRPGAKGGANLYHQMYRSAAPYEARHLPWYVNSADPGAEELYYIKNVKQETQWSQLHQTLMAPALPVQATDDGCRYQPVGK